MARGRRTVSRMEKAVFTGRSSAVGGGTPAVIVQAIQLDGGEVEAQVKRIMLSAADSTGSKACTFKLGLFQFTPTVANFNEDEAIVLSGAIGNQFHHNETITMRVPKDWYVGLLLEQQDVAGTSEVTYALQLNYKVLN